MKICFKCGVEKELDAFYKHPKMADGRVNKCKECNKSDVRANRLDKREYYRAYDRKRGNRQDKAYRDSDRAAKQNAYIARSKFCYAVKAGHMKRRTTCEECGSTGSIHAHHDDYNYPLDVRWLCCGCHSQWHKVNGEGLNG